MVYDAEPNYIKNFNINEFPLKIYQKKKYP